MNLIKKNSINKNYILAVIIPFIIYIFICVINGFFIFGNNTFAIKDAYYQYVPFPYFFANNIINGKFSMWSTSAGMGMDLIPTFTYYSMSPLNLLYIIFHNTNPYMIYDVLVLIRMILTSFIATYVIIYLNKNDKYSFLFGLMYTFSGYYIAYYFNSIWMDSVMLFPLIYYFLKKYIEENNKKYLVKYSILLLFIFLSNFYIAYEICIFIIIIFLLSDFKNLKDFIKKGLNIFISSILPIFSGCFFCIYSVLYLVENSAGSLDSGYRFTILDYFKSFIFGKVWEIDNSCIYLYFTTLGLFLFVSFLLNKNNLKKDRIKAITFVGISILFAANPYLNLFIHGFDSPNFLYNRYSFILIFIFIDFAYKQFLKRKDTPKKVYIISSIICLIPSLMLLVLKNLKLSGFECDDFIIFSNIILVIIIFFLFIKDKIKLLTIFSIFEIFFFFVFSVALTIPGTKKENININHNENYNINTIKQNYWALYDVDSLYVFSSGINKNVSKFIYPLTHTSGNVSYANDFGNPFVYSLFGVSHIYNINETNEILPNSLFKVYNKDDNLYYEYKYPLSLGYAIEEDISNLNFFNNKSDVISDNNKLFKLITGLDKDFIKNVQIETINIQKDAAEIVFKENAENVILSNYSLAAENYFFQKVEEGQKYSFKNSVGEIIDIYAISYDIPTFIEGINKLMENQLEIIKTENNYLSGKINLEQEKYMLFRLTYNDNWHAYIDGEEVDIIAVDNALMELKVPEGEHIIEFKYIDDLGHFKYLIYFNIVSFIIFILYSIYIYKKEDHLD